TWALDRSALHSIRNTERLTTLALDLNWHRKKGRLEIKTEERVLCRSNAGFSVVQCMAAVCQRRTNNDGSSDF
ncbi:hypothetical protein N9Z64_02795, partial [bacterium]|nr:hypothetical protein [bacterium]